MFHKQIHVALSGLTCFLAMRLVNRAHVSDTQEQLLQAKLARAHDLHATQRAALLEHATELSRQAGLRPAAAQKFEAALRSFDAQLDQVQGIVGCTARGSWHPSHLKPSVCDCLSGC
jgi:hypothetical protein